MTYFGFKSHTLTTVDGFVTDYVITPANIDDRNAVWNLCDKHPKEIRELIFKARRRIEARFSQLTGQLNLNKVKSKSKLGFIARTSIKVLAHNISFLINKLFGHDNSFSRLVFG